MKQLLPLLLSVLASAASGLDTGIRIQDGSSSTNSKSSSITISAMTNLNTGSLVVSNVTSSILKTSAGGAVQAAVSSTDYAPATSGSAILKGNGSGGFSSAVAGTDYQSANANIVNGSGTTAANDVTVFTDTTHTNIARSTSAATVGDASSATFTWTFNLSGATDPALTAANALLSFNTPLDVVVGTADTTALKVRGGSVTGSGTTTLIDLSGTWNTSGNATFIRGYATNTASGATAKLLDIGIDTSTSRFSVDKTGNAVIAGALTSGNITIGAANVFQMTGRGGFLSTSDGVFYFRDSTGTGFNSLQLGPTDSSPNNASLLGVTGSGTDIAGGALNLSGGVSTGTGRGGAVVVNTPLSAASTGSSANSLTPRAYYSAKPVTLTESTATTFANIAVPSGTYAGGILTVTVFASDGTDHQSLTSQVRVDGVNKAGTVTPSVTQTDNTAAVSSGTLTCTYTVVASGNSFDVKANAVSSLSQTTLHATWSVTTLNANGVATITPQ